MKRKLLIAATSFMIASSVCGKDFNVLTKDFQPWGNTQFDMEGMKIDLGGIAKGYTSTKIMDMAGGWRRIVRNMNPHGLSFGRFCPWMSCS